MTQQAIKEASFLTFTIMAKLNHHAMHLMGPRYFKTDQHINSKAFGDYKKLKNLASRPKLE